MIFKHHKYIYSKPYGSARHHWELVGPTAAMHFHVSITEGYDASCGLEIHYFNPPEYMADQAPSHLDCKLAGARCWHDGTSLYAQEQLWPMIKGYLADPDKVFKILEVEYDSRFSGESVTVQEALIKAQKETP